MGFLYKTSVIPITLKFFIAQDESRHLHKEIAEAALVRTCSADQIVEIGREWNTFARGRVDVDTVAGEVAIVAEVYPGCSTLVELDVGCWSSKGDRSGECGDGCGELHVVREACEVCKWLVTEMFLMMVLSSVAFRSVGLR